MKNQQVLNLGELAKTTILQHKSEILLFLCGCSFLYVIFSLIPITVLVAMIVCLLSFGAYLAIKWRNLRQKRIITQLSPGKKQLLTEKSIFDIYRDLIYFPKVAKIVGAFVKGAISKPHPDQLHEAFDQLPESVIKTINTKGILHLAPENVQKMFLQVPENTSGPQNEFKLPNNYGQIDYSWYNKDKYHGQELRIHEYTAGKQVANALNQKIKWKHLIALSMIVAYGLFKTRGKKMGKIIIYNGSLLGVFLLVIMLLVKTSKPLKKYKIKN